MIKINEAIVVEGKYDKIKLSSIVDGLIIETNGFRIFKDKEKINLLRNLAKKRGILIFTDSDSAGFLIRNYISSIIPKENIKHAYIPDIYGKEKRKYNYSKEGKLGVEGIPKKIIEKSLKDAGVIFKETELVKKNKREITKIDLYDYGLSGRDNSSELRKVFLKQLNFPEHLSVNSLIKVLNCSLTYEEFEIEIKKLLKLYL